MNAAHDAILDPQIGWIILAIFSALWIFLGWLWGRNVKDLEGFMLAGRNVGMALGVATAMATWVTSNTTMTAPQLAYQLGIWGMVGYSLGSVGLLMFAPLARRIRQLLPYGFTSGDFIRRRYGPIAWVVFLIISLVYAVGWLISLGMAGGVLINALTGIDYLAGMTVILSICVLYTLLGGLRAVIGTDFIQTILILVGLVVLGYLAIDKIGFDQIHDSVLQRRPELLNLLMPAAIMFLFNNLLFGVGEIFHSNVWWSRAFAFRTDVGFRAYLTAGLMWVPIPIVAGFIALAAPGLDLNVPSADMVGPMVAAKLLGVGGAILVFVVVFSALASSLDSLLAATSDLLMQDVYKGMMNKTASEVHLRKASKYIILLLGIVTWLLCYWHPATLAKLLHFLGAFVASTIWPIVAGLYWKKTNRVGATLAMALGSIVGLCAYFFIFPYVAAVVGAAVSMVIVLVTTWLWPHEFDWKRLEQTNTQEAKA
jgi:Na+/proline symporter